MTPLEQVKEEIDDLANSVINLTEENARLRAALEAQLEAHNFDEILEIARKALAKEGK